MDIFFATLNAIIASTIPMIIRYITSEVLFFEKNEALKITSLLGLAILGLFAILYYCNYFTLYYGHIMGAKIEQNMRSELFAHYQELSISFYNNNNVWSHAIMEKKI